MLFDPGALPPMPDRTRRSSPNLPTGLGRSLCRRCPACGEGSLFDGYLEVSPLCAVCGNDNERYSSDDMALCLTIFLLLHLMVPLLLEANRVWNMSVLLEGAIAIPISFAAVLAQLPFVKGAVIGFSWAFGLTRGHATET